MSGHFGDPLAKTCAVTESDPAIGPVPSPGQAIEICQTAFVLTDIRRLDAPATDSAVLRAAQPVMIWHVAALGLATAVALAFALLRLSGTRPRSS